MFDLELVPMQMCASINGPRTMGVPSDSDPLKTYTVSGLFCERTWPKCTCPGYRFARKKVNFGGRMVPELCKHILKAQEMVCGWHQLTGKAQTEEQRKNHICPECGGPTVDVLVGV